MISDKDKFIASLVSEHGIPLEKYLARKLDSPEDAAELAQEAYMRLHRLEQPENLNNARAFLFQVATNLAVDQLRRRQLHFKFLKSEKSLSAHGEPLDINAAAASPEQILGARQKLDATGISKGTQNGAGGMITSPVRGTKMSKCKKAKI